MEEVVNPEVPVTEEPIVESEVSGARPQPGEKTDPALLLKSLQEERELKREEREERMRLQRELDALKSAPKEDIAVSDVGKNILKEVYSLKTELDTMKTEKILGEVMAANPALKDKQAEFDEYRLLPENTGMSLQTAAKAFLVEKDLVEMPRPRKGLESASGGGRVPQKVGMTASESEALRVNNYREYSRRVRNGTLNIT